MLRTLANMVVSEKQKRNAIKLYIYVYSYKALFAMGLL